MEENFYSSTEATEITGCTRRQLQYWRQKEVIVPTVNPGGKGRNVYYSQSDLLALTVMEYLLSLGLSFELAVDVLLKLRNQEASFFEMSAEAKEMKQFMLSISVNNTTHKHFLDFDEESAFEMIRKGNAVVPIWCDRIYQRLQHNLAHFGRQMTLFDDHDN
jgi:DNA-binding transcriptional MerR regulator